MVVELPKPQRADAIASLQQYFERNMPEAIGDLAAALLLDFFLQEIGPAVFNAAVKKTADRMQLFASELDGELYEAPFTYWTKTGKQKR